MIGAYQPIRSRDSRRVAAHRRCTSTSPLFRHIGQQNKQVWPPIRYTTTRTACPWQTARTCTWTSVPDNVSSFCLSTAASRPFTAPSIYFLCLCFVGYQLQTVSSLLEAIPGLRRLPAFWMLSLLPSNTRRAGVSPPSLENTRASMCPSWQLAW